MEFIKSIQLKGLLSYPTGSPPIELGSLNVLIGPNGSGKSNLIEGLELLHAAPTAFAAAVRDGGGAREWLWKGKEKATGAEIEAVVNRAGGFSDLRYRLAFAPVGQRMEVIDEAVEEAYRVDDSVSDVFFYYRYQNGRPAINVCSGKGKSKPRHLERQSLVPDESVLSQRKDPDAYPELTWLGRSFGRIQTFREWSFGRYPTVRLPQPADLPVEYLSPDARNLGLILNQIENGQQAMEFSKVMAQFLPRYERFSTHVLGGTIQFYLHEKGLNGGIPATRLSDGTIRMLAILAMLLAPEPPPLLCIEEPELGLHPDALHILAYQFVLASQRMQLIITTHSDALISALTEHVESVLVCENRGGTVINRLDPNKLGHWLNKYRLGELWRIGEIGGNP